MIKIGNKEIGSHSKPFIIAEMSGNHNQSLDRALYLVELAAKSGADAIKLQTYTPDTITLDVYTNEFFINNENSLWKGQSLYDLYKQDLENLSDLGFYIYTGKNMQNQHYIKVEWTRDRNVNIK